MDAEALATRLHAGQVDKRGQPYVEHLRAVVGNLLRRWPDAPEWAVEAAWLHDAVEDVPHVDPNALEKAYGVSLQTIDLVLQVTRPKFLPYPEWIAHLAVNADLWAIRIKLADLEHNMDPGRAIPGSAIPGSDIVQRRYAPARRVLEASLATRDRTPAPEGE